MNWDDVQKTVAGRYDAAARALDIEAADFSSAAMVHDLFAQTLRAQSLRLTDVAALQNGGGTITARGMIQGAPRLTDVQVPATAVFSFVQNEPQLVLAFGIPPLADDEAWSFGDYFPQLANTAIDELENAPRPLPLFIYSSYDHTETGLYPDGSAVALKAGLNFHGGLIPDSAAFEILATIAGEIGNMALTGPIQLYDYGPSFNLVLDQQTDLSKFFQKAHLPLTLALTCSFSPDGHYYTAGLSLSTHVDLGQARGLTLKTVLMSGAQSWVTLNGAFQNVALPGPADIIDLVGGDGSDFNQLLPDELRSSGGIYLDSMWISIAPTGPSLACVGFGVTTAPDKSWTIIPDWFALKSISGRLNVYDPFGKQRAAQLTLTGTIGVPSRDPALQVEAGITFPKPTVTARLAPGTTFDLPKLIGKFVPTVADVLPLTFETLSLVINLSQKPVSYRISARSSESKTWQFGGSEPVHFTALNLELGNSGAGGAVVGFVGGSVLLFGYESSGIYNIGGSFQLNAQLPNFTIDLRDFAKRLVGSDMGLPDWLPAISFTHTEISIAHSAKDAASDTLALRTSIGTGGKPLLLAFEALKTGGQWGFVVGIDASIGKLSDLPGLSGLSVIDDIVRLEEILAIISSASLPSYSFPMASRFNDPTLKSTQLRMPGQAGQINAGLYVYARWKIDTRDKLQRLLHTMLRLQGELGITLQIGKQPTQDAKLYVSYSGKINGHPLAAELGVAMANGQAGFFLQGTLQAPIQNRECDFQIEMMVVANGAFFSGSMVGSVSFEGLTLSNLALVIGCDWEGIPSLGVACSLTVKSFNSALAVFFDSTQPSRSMLAGAVSDLKLKDVVETLSRSRLPKELETVLAQVALLHVKEFIIDGALSDDLDNLKLDRLAAAFKTNGVPLSTSSRDVLVVVGEKGKTWFLSNMRDNMMHYELMKSGSSIRVMLNPQFYCVPQITSLGALKFEQGFFITARLKVLIFDAQATVLIKPTKGILVDGELDKIVIWKQQLFGVTSADGQRGPRVSVATFSQPEQTDPALRGPHFLIDGKISLLGLNRHAFVTVSEKGFHFEIGGDVMPAFNVDLKGDFNDLKNFSAGGDMKIGVGTVDLGPLGKATIATAAHAALKASFDGHAVLATIAAGFKFTDQDFTIPTFNLDLDQGLAKLPARIADEVIAALKRFLTDATKWADLVGHDVLTGVTNMADTLRNTFKFGTDSVSVEVAAQLMKSAKQTADQVAGGLRHAFGQNADQVAQAMKGAGYAADEVAGALHSAYDFSADQAAHALKAAGYTADEAGKALQSAYHASADVAAKALNGAGYAVDQVGNVLKSTYHVASDQVGKVLQGAGYAANDVGKFFGKAGDAITDTAKKAGDTITDTGKKVVDKLNPKNWF